MKQHRLKPGALLNAEGALIEAGYATGLVKQYDRGAIRGGRLRIKEWDYYLVYNNDFGLALTIDDNSYMGLVSASFLDFRKQTETTVSPMYWLPMGRVGFPASSAAGDVEKRAGKAHFAFRHVPGGRRLTVDFPDFDGGQPLTADVLLTDEPRDSMVIATPFPEKKTAFYYNQKILGMRASGTVCVRGQTYLFEPETSFGLLDWGRGVWTYDNVWYWGAGQGVVDGHVVAFNIGYGFGDTSRASENMLFYDGTAHKLDRVTFHIPRGGQSDEDYLAPWTFSSSDGRFEMDFQPFLDRKSRTAAGPILSDQHQVFGRMTGTMILDDGTKIQLKEFTAFAEKVHNKW